MSSGYHPLDVHTPVQVRISYDGSWSNGFEIFSGDRERHYRLRRLSDGAVLPTWFSEGNVRATPERRD